METNELLEQILANQKETNALLRTLVGEKAEKDKNLNTGKEIEELKKKWNTKVEDSLYALMNKGLLPRPRSTRLRNILYAEDIETIGELLQVGKNHVRCFGYVGKIMRATIDEYISLVGLSEYWLPHGISLEKAIEINSFLRNCYKL